jgi:hypothetical protein
MWLAFDFWGPCPKAPILKREIPFYPRFLGALPPDPKRGVTPPPEPRGLRGGGFRFPPPPTPLPLTTTRGSAPGPQIKLSSLDLLDLQIFGLSDQ